MGKRRRGGGRHVATLPGRTYGLGLIKEPLRDDLKIGDLQFSLMNFWAVVVGAAAVMPAGWLIDRIGTRGTLALVAAALGAAVLLMARAADPTELVVALTLVRGLGQGALSVVAIALVGKWFRRRDGAAMGVFSVLLGLGFVLPMGAVQAGVESAGWRAAWAGVGLALLFGLVPLGLLLARSTPEACGVTTDEPAAGTAAPPMNLLGALQTPAFWVYTLAATVFNLVFSALTLDNELLLTEHGLDRSANARVMAVMFVTGLASNLATGYLARQVRLGRLLGAGVVALAASLAVFPAVGDLAVMAAFAALLGAAGGVITVVYFAVYGHTYGRTHLGSIQAAVQVLSVFASASGPVLLSAVREGNDGSTTPFFVAFAVIAAGLAAGAWAVRPPNQGEGANGVA